MIHPVLKLQHNPDAGDDSSPSGNISQTDPHDRGKEFWHNFIRPSIVVSPDEKIYALRPRQRWEGQVTEVGDGGFTAVLTDLTNPELSDEEAVFTFSEFNLPDDELVLVQPGSFFYWTIGTERTPAGVIKNVSILQFRRSPRWSSNKIKTGRSKGDRFGKLFPSTT